MRILATLIGLIISSGIHPNADAGDRSPRRATPIVPGPMVTPNGMVVPTWAARRIEISPVPLAGYAVGRRPWAYPLANENTPSARMARADQLGIGAGPIPGYTNGPPLGNYPQAAVGPTGNIASPRGPGNRWNNNVAGAGYPFNVYINGN